MSIVITYSGKSSITGKLLKNKLSAIKKITNKKINCDVFIRWGSTDNFTGINSRLTLNSLHSVSGAINKLKMLQTFNTAGIPIPNFSTESMEGLLDDTGNVYIRNKQGVTRYGNDFNSSVDSYVTQPMINKRREYRVHVFNSKILAIYEKVPNEVGTKLFKSYNCHFRKVDPAISRCDSIGQQISIDAVNSLGLLFGGVDLMRDKQGNFLVSEVNSAPALNSTNLDRWVNAIVEYTNGVNN